MRKEKKIIFTLIFFVYFLVKNSFEQNNITNIVVLPFKTYKESYKKDGIFNISSFLNNNIYTKIIISDMTLIVFFKSNLPKKSV